MQNIDLKQAKKSYGFDFIPKGDNQYYYVRYKEPETGKWAIKKITNANNEKEALHFAITNRDKIISEYQKRNSVLKSKRNNKEFIKMLVEYYKPESIYLQDDRANNKREITTHQRSINNSFLRKYLIPYLNESKINSFSEINKSVYSGLKSYLLGKQISKKTINNYLLCFMRILQYCERNELIDKLPYSRGAGLLRITNEDKTKIRTPAILPTKYLNNIYSCRRRGR
jgi:hypothetical protein